MIASSPCHWSVPSQQINTQKAQSRKKKAHIPPEYKMCTVCCLTIIQSCYFDYRINKPFACSRCVICVLCSVHVISTYYVCKGSWAFYLNYPQINEVGKSGHVGKFVRISFQVFHQSVSVMLVANQERLSKEGPINTHYL